MLKLETSWDEVYAEAKRRQLVREPWKSASNDKMYEVSENDHNQPDRILIRKIDEGTDKPVTKKDVEEIVLQLLDHKKLHIHKDKFPTKEMERVVVATIVRLHPWLDYDGGGRGNKHIIVRDSPKPNAALK